MDGGFGQGIPVIAFPMMNIPLLQLSKVMSEGKGTRL